jgi:hypothetical protein
LASVKNVACVSKSVSYRATISLPQRSPVGMGPTVCSTSTSTAPAHRRATALAHGAPSPAPGGYAWRASLTTAPTTKSSAGGASPTGKSVDELGRKMYAPSMPAGNAASPALAL